MGLSSYEAEQYWKAIPILEAQELLVNLKVQDFPHMKSGPRQRLYRELQIKANPREFRDFKPITPEEMKRVLNG